LTVLDRGECSMALQRVLGQPVEDPRSASRHFLGRAPPRLIMARRAAPTHSASVLPDEGRCQMPYYMVQSRLFDRGLVRDW